MNYSCDGYYVEEEEEHPLRVFEERQRVTVGV
jgi:hypothetical protein